MQSERSEQIPSGPEDDTLSQTSKRRRTYERSTRSNLERSESSNALSTGRRTLTTSSPQRGSSRDMTPPEGTGSIKYTRTGRVSKATKGSRVHHCDECGKVSRNCAWLPRSVTSAPSQAYATALPCAPLTQFRHRCNGQMVLLV